MSVGDPQEKKLFGYVVTNEDWRREAYAPKTLASEHQEMKACLRTLANFGGGDCCLSLQQAKELAQKCLDKLEEK